MFKPFLGKGCPGLLGQEVPGQVGILLYSCGRRPVAGLLLAALSRSESFAGGSLGSGTSDLHAT